MKQVPLTNKFLDAMDPSIQESRDYAREVISNKRCEYAEAWEDDEGPLLAWGVIEMWDGVGTIWITLDVRCQKKVRALIVLAKGALERAFVHFTRLQGEFHNRAPTWKFARHLGFEIEGYMKNYGVGGEGDYVLCARVNDGGR